MITGKDFNHISLHSSKETKVYLVKEEGEGKCLSKEDRRLLVESLTFTPRVHKINCFHLEYKIDRSFVTLTIAPLRGASPEIIIF
jgi:hypothetical protein